MEVIAGMTLMTMLMVPTMGLLTASARIWRQFESGHGSVAVRQATIQDIGNRIDGAIAVVSASEHKCDSVRRRGITNAFIKAGHKSFGNTLAVQI